MEEETLHSSSTSTFRPTTSRRTPSFSSSNSSSFSSTEDFYQFSPITNKNTPSKFKGVPFSWEQIPGIPKHHRQIGGASHKDGVEHLLPLPPAGNYYSNSSGKKLLHQEEISPKKSSNNRSQRDNDPFFAALVECSKDDHHHHHHGNNISKNIVTRSLSGRFGFINMYTSCKRTCNVSESIVYLPSRPSPHYLLNNRRS